MRMLALLWLVATSIVFGDVREELLGRLEGGEVVFSTDPRRGGAERFEMWIAREKGGNLGMEWWLHGDGERSGIVQVNLEDRVPVFYSAGGLSAVHSSRLPGMMNVVLGAAARFDVNDEEIAFKSFVVGRERERWVEIGNNVIESRVMRALRAGAPVVKREVDGEVFFWVYLSPDRRAGLIMAGEGAVCPVSCVVFESRDEERFWIWIGEPREDVEPVTLEALRNGGLRSRLQNLYRWRARTEDWNSSERSKQKERLKRLELPLESLMRTGAELEVEVVGRFRDVLAKAGWTGIGGRAGSEVLVAEPWIELGNYGAVWRELWKCEMLFPEGEDRLVLPFSWWKDCPLVELNIDGEVVERVVLDTGAELTILANSVASFDGDWSVSKVRRLFGLGGDRALETREVGSVEVGGIKTALTSIAVVELDENLGVGGFLGRDLLGTVPFTIDPLLGQVVFHRPGAFSPPVGALRVEIVETEDELPLVAIELGEGKEPLMCLPDTGFSSFLSVSEAALEERVEPRWIERRMFGQTTGPFGSVAVDKVRLSEEGAGKFEAFGRKLGSGVIDISAEDEGHGVIGMGVLGRYRVTFDFRAKAMYLEAVDGSGIPTKSELFEAVKRGDVEVVGRLLDAGAVPDRAEVGQAIGSGQVDVLRRFDAVAPGVLVERREEVEAAVFRGDVGMVRYLLEWGVDVRGTRDGYSLLAPALAGGSGEMVELLLGAGVGVSQRDVGMVLGGDVEARLVVELLEAAGAEVLGELVPDGILSGVADLPWLSLAARNSCGEAVRFFIERGDPVDRLAGNGVPALVFAVAKGNREAVEVLLEAGADVSFKIGGKGGVLSAAAELGEGEMLE
ncbi:MAG: hypothetical protein P8J87_04515, partial [Verrucomicrobiales bacterium]|nr:hypothetical protein [Verrucomicrobiales bacterium]